MNHVAMARLRNTGRLAGLFVLSLSVSVATQKSPAPFVRLTESQARVAADLAFANAKPEASSFESLLMDVFRSMSADYSGVEIVHRSDSLTVVIAGPVAKFQIAAKERVRRFEPLSGTSWDPTVSVIVQPSQIGSPDIDKVLVHRNGAVVAPLRSDLVPISFETSLGAKRMIHAGSVTFHLDAFAPSPDAMVTVTAIPVSGQNLAKSLKGTELRRIQ